LEYATDDEEDVVTDTSYQTPLMASASPATIPPEAVVEVPTPAVTCACGEVVEKAKDEEELVLCSEVDAVGSDSSEEVVPEENVVPLLIATPPPVYSPVRGQRARQSLPKHSY